MSTIKTLKTNTMKIKASITILLFTLFVNNTCLAQTKLQPTDSISFSMPTGTAKFYDEEFFKSFEKTFSKEFADRWYKTYEIYKFEDIIFRFISPKIKLKNSKPVNYDATYILKTSKSLDDIFGSKANAHLYKNYSRETNTINGNEVVIASYQDSKGLLTYKFACFSPSKRKSFSGEVVGKSDDNVQITKILNDLFKSVEFK